MTGRNTYATLADYKAYWVSRGASNSADASDDMVIGQLLETASRYLDSKTGRNFYPRVEDRNFDVPGWDSVNYSFQKYRSIDFDGDLLEVITFTNGDGSVITSSDYNLLPNNYYPKYALQLRFNSTIVWQPNSLGDFEGVINVLGIYGYKPYYDVEGWLNGGTLGAAITDTTTKAFTMASGHTLANGQIVKINNELYIIDTVSTNTITPLKRGDNGSTAATHSNGATVYIWQPMEEARNAVCEIANTAYRRRFGQSTSNTETVTGAGVVLSPRDIPALAEEFIKVYQRRM